MRTPNVRTKRIIFWSSYLSRVRNVKMTLPMENERLQSRLTIKKRLAPPRTRPIDTQKIDDFLLFHFSLISPKFFNRFSSSWSHFI